MQNAEIKIKTVTVIFSSFCLQPSALAFFQRPFIPPVRMAMAMRGKKPAAKLPEPRPDLLAVRLRDFQIRDFFTREKFKTAFTHRRRQQFQFHLHLEQKHQPMRLRLISMLADDSGQMQIRGRNFQSGFFLRLAAGAGVGRFAEVHLQFAAARAPKSAIWFLRAFEQQNFARLVEAIQQRRDFEISRKFRIHGENRNFDFIKVSPQASGCRASSKIPPHPKS